VRRVFAALAFGLNAASPAQAADIEAGKATAASVCAPCHGMTGVSTGEPVPNLAGQRPGYLESQMNAMKSGSRKSPVMGEIAAKLTPTEMANAAAYFASLKAAAEEGKSDFLPSITKTGMAFPENYKAAFTKYHTLNFPATRQVRYFYANGVAMQAAKVGKALPDGAILLAEVHAAKIDLMADKPEVGPDGFYVPGALLYYIAMERQPGWGKDVPEVLRNEDWNYAVFTRAKQQRPGVNLAECLACHKPLDEASYAFTLKELTAAAKK
jgi:cytochrome c553